MMLLKSTSKGSVKLSLSKPVPYSKFKNDDDKIIIHNDQDMNNNQRLSCITKTKTTTQITNNHQNPNSQLLLQMEQLRQQFNQGLISLEDYLSEIKKLINGANIN
ncbi:unnamed protein product [Rotaria sp. Silwood1]|nr:unnamed protein product [Rotaria sp. Silwood1]CAF3668061.1 unnamed protein product [Rotaria sp. Silwood1]CAF4681174.1 unnamed protein product [Rotaria sp. Silwood1]CAF4815007.1 unnamed protein product [Rotaria sp. Silwood1]